MYPSFGNLSPRDISSRAAKRMVDSGRGVGPLRNGVYLDFADSIHRLGEKLIADRYGNLFDMYENITGENAYKAPMRIYPAPHYTMGGLWVDYYLMSNISGLFVIGEANFSDHGANRLGASALMQGLADGYFVLPSTLPNYIASTKLEKVDENADAVKEAIANVQGITNRLMSVKGTKSVDHYHRELGRIVWDYCGMSRTAEGLEKALTLIPELEADFWENVRVTGGDKEINRELEKAGRLVDYFGIGKLMCLDALERNESCGGHFREEYQTADGEALRNDKEYSYVAAWQYAGDDQKPILHKETLAFETVKLATRSYK